MDAHEGWLLGRHGPGHRPGTNFELRDTREIKPDEHRQFVLDQALLGGLSTDNNLNELARSYRDISDDATALLADAKSVRSREGNATRRRHMDAYLNEFTSFRRRLEKFVTTHFGDEAGGRLAATFEDAYRNQKHYRLAWELRNDTQHSGEGPLDHTRVTQAMEGEGEDGHRVDHWIFQLNRLWEAHPGDKRWRKCEDLWEGQRTVEVSEVLAYTFGWCHMTYSHAIFFDTDAIRAAAHRAIGLHQEVFDGKSAPILYRTFPLFINDQGKRTMNFEEQAINAHLAAEALQTIEDAAAAVADFAEQQRQRA